MRAIRITLSLVLFSLGMHVHAADSSTCVGSGDEAALRFVEAALKDPKDSVSLLRPRSLTQFRARLVQILDDRYAPDSGPFRQKFLGPEWTASRIGNASDKEIVGEYLANGARQRPLVQLSDIKIVESKQTRYMGDEITVSYRLSDNERSSLQQRTFNAFTYEGCWTLDVPIEAWARLEQIAKILKASRSDVFPSRQGSSRVSLQVVPASESPYPGAMETPRRRDDGAVTSVWVDRHPLLTEIDVVGAVANWDCERPGLEPEAAAVRVAFRERAAQRLKKWSERNIGSTLAIVVKGEALTFARVASTLGDRLTICLPMSSLDEADELAAALLGKN